MSPQINDEDIESHIAFVEYKAALKAYSRLLDSVRHRRNPLNAKDTHLLYHVIKIVKEYTQYTCTNHRDLDLTMSWLQMAFEYDPNLEKSVDQFKEAIEESGHMSFDIDHM